MALPVAAAEARLEFPVRHKRMLRDCGGRLVFEEARMVFESVCRPGKARPAVTLPYEEIQLLELYGKRMILRGYRDRVWLAGADEVWDFRFEGSFDPGELYRFLRERMDRRLSARFPYEEGTPLWRLPAKAPAWVEGAQGELALYDWGLVFASGKPGASRIWRDADIDSISTAAPLDFAVQTGEGEFRFQLKRMLPPVDYDRLWLRLNRARGLTLLPPAGYSERK
jgi:hypothetical protein